MQGNKILVNAFTQTANGRVREIISNIGVSIPYSQNFSPNVNPPQVIQFKGLWDTGATNSVIRSNVVQQLNLKPINTVEVSHAGGKTWQNVHLVNIYLPNNINIQGVQVTEAPGITGNFDLIIGMDIIGISDFAITNANNKTLFSFQIPSIAEVDFVKIGQKITNQQAPIHVTGKIGRNDKCPCGSGKKYKFCHGLGKN